MPRHCIRRRSQARKQVWQNYTVVSECPEPDIRYEPVAGTGSRRLAAANSRGGVYLSARFLRDDESGATAIEYGLIFAGIALAILAILGTTGEQLVALLNGLLAAFSVRRRALTLPSPASGRGKERAAQAERDC